MDKCKACGKPVGFPIMVHAACWEHKIDRMVEVFCDKYCKFPDLYPDEDALDEHCGRCHLVEALNLGLGRYRETEEKVGDGA